MGKAINIGSKYKGDGFMKYKLMHRRTAVAELEIDEAIGCIEKIYSIHSPRHLPVGISMKKGIVDRASLNTWWCDRAIPTSRMGIRGALETLNVTSTITLVLRSYGLSLSDQYWVCPEQSGLEWENINFYDNSFSEDMGDVLFGNREKALGLDFLSPDATTDGCLKKRWKIIDGKRCLVKSGSNPFRQQPFNEVIACKIAARLGIPHIPYTLIWDNGEPYSVCEGFVTSDTELVSAWRILQTQKKDNQTSVYRHFLNCCNALGAPDVVPALDRMIALDYLIANEDRHLNNFGLLRNAETLEWIGFAPIYDSGSSLGYDMLVSQIRAEKDIPCKPFKKNQDEQLQLVSTFEWMDMEKLSDIEASIRDTFSDERAKEYIPENRISAIVESLGRRIEKLALRAMAHISAQDFTVGDVEENIAEEYLPKL